MHSIEALCSGQPWSFDIEREAKKSGIAVALVFKGCIVEAKKERCRKNGGFTFIRSAAICVLIPWVPLAGAERKGDKTDDPPRLLWRQPRDIRSKNLVYGSGGKANFPATTQFTFVAEDVNGTAPKFDLVDAKGNRWKAKVGGEARGETAASRLVWATGYFTDDMYFFPEIRVTGLPQRLKRGQQHVAGDGTVRNVRLERFDPNRQRINEWEWKDRDWMNRRDWNGLRVLMALLNNWDLKDSNTAIYAVHRSDGRIQHIYVVTDLGASFGPTHIDVRRTKTNLKRYARSKFLDRAQMQTVDFATPGTPSLLYFFSFCDFIRRLGLNSIGRDIPRSDARWMGQLLAQLSPKQIRDAFRGAGFTDDEVEGYAQVVEGRIRVLTEL